MPSCIVSLTAAKYGKKVAVLDYVSPSTQGKEVGCRFHFGFILDSPGVSLQASPRTDKLWRWFCLLALTVKFMAIAPEQPIIEGDVRVCSDVVLRYFWCGFTVIQCVTMATEVVEITTKNEEDVPFQYSGKIWCGLQSSCAVLGPPYAP